MSKIHAYLGNMSKDEQLIISIRIHLGVEINTLLTVTANISV